MKQFICADCNNIFGEDEFATVREYRGEFWGFPAYETISVCPFCHSDAIDDYKENEEENEENEE